jgi:hypothetical protein
MAELVMSLARTKADVVDALRMKSLLWDKGIELSGVVVRKNGGELIPRGFLEDMIQLRVVGTLL